MSATAVHHISSFSPGIEFGNLTPVQVQVVGALAEGRSVIRAAAAAGIHRTTIHNWMRTSEEFRSAVDQARDHFAACVADQLKELSAAALDTLRQMLASGETPPTVRLRAALAVLERPGGLPETGWQLPEPVRLPRIPTPPIPLPVVAKLAPRNAACHCGSGLKFKRCCGSSAPSPAPRAPMDIAARARLLGRTEAAPARSAPSAPLSAPIDIAARGR